MDEKDGIDNKQSKKSPVKIGEMAVSDSKQDATDINSVDTDVAVKSIIQEDSQALLGHQDNQKQQAIKSQKKKRGLGRFMAAWWNNKLARNMTLLLIVAGLVALAVIPATRYAILNAFGVRAGISFTVADKISGKPVKNVNVKVGEATATTGDDGGVAIEDIKLGATDIMLSKRSFQEETIPVVIGWGSNPFEAPFEITPTGTTFEFTVTDWLDDGLIAGAEVTDGESVAVSDENGVAALTIEPTDEGLEVTISAKGYREEKLTIPADSTDPQAVKLVADKPDIFISKRSGKYDLYSRSIDGKNEVVILPGTGKEQANTEVSRNPEAGNIAVLLSSRAGNRNAGGNILSDLYLLDTNGNKVTKIHNSESENITIIGWSGDSVVFTRTINGITTDDFRVQAYAYDYKNDRTSELASEQHLASPKLVDNALYFAVYSDDKDSLKSGLKKVGLGGEPETTLINGNIWSIFRTGINELTINGEGDVWYKVETSSGTVSKVAGAPPQLTDIEYYKGEGQVVYLEHRDGKTSMLLTSIDGNSPAKEIYKQNGLGHPVVWINEKTILFGVNSSDESAHYVIKIDGDKPIKVGDVSVSLQARAGY